MLVRQLEEELRLRMRQPNLEMQQQMEAIYAENDHLQREISILRETIKDLECRVETQKQTLIARDESIKKLLEMLQAKGMGKSIRCWWWRRLPLCSLPLSHTPYRQRGGTSDVPANASDGTKTGKSFSKFFHVLCISFFFCEPVSFQKKNSLSPSLSLSLSKYYIYIYKIRIFFVCGKQCSRDNDFVVHQPWAEATTTATKWLKKRKPSAPQK